jgi:hypothetical protein
MTIPHCLTEQEYNYLSHTVDFHVAATTKHPIAKKSTTDAKNVLLSLKMEIGGS